MKSAAFRVFIAAALLLSACYPTGQGPAGSPSPVAGKAAAIAHGGASNPAKNSDGTRKAVDAALAALAAGADPVDAAVAGTIVLEDDPRFNAGTGARVRIDGETVQMDASLMTSEGRFAAIGAIERVKNPIVVTRALLDSPHLFLSGEGATRFARTFGLPDYDPATPDAKAKAKEVRRKLVMSDPSLPEKWKTFDWKKHWNFTKPIAAAMADVQNTPAAATPSPAATDPGLIPGSDTVGVAVRTADGRYAVALSTGGTSITLSGRIGDVPVYGAGLWAGPKGAIAATGEGERIIEAGLAREMHRWMEEGATADEAAKRAVAMLRERGDIGVIVIDATTMSADCNKPMAWAARDEGSATWQGPEPGK